LPGQLDDVDCQSLFIVAAFRDLALRRAMLAERRAGATLGDGQLDDVNLPCVTELA
jgi:hypothetical protein